jgi:hypothetical protein
MPNDVPGPIEILVKDNWRKIAIALIIPGKQLQW